MATQFPDYSPEEPLPPPPRHEPEDLPAEGPAIRRAPDNPTRLPPQEDPPVHGPIDDPDQEFPGKNPEYIDPPLEGDGQGAPVQEPEVIAT